MTLKDFRGWIKPQIKDLKACYSGKIDASKECIIGLYTREGSSNKIAIGGLECTSTAHKTISILVHWNKNYDESEIKAKEIYDLLEKHVCEPTQIGGVDAFFVLRNDEPIGVGTDDHDIFEFVIDINIKYKRG